MDLFEAIKSRSSIRKYVPYKISKEEEKAILDAGFCAPSAMNRRPYELIVNTDNEFFKEMKDVKPTCEIMSTCALTVLVVGDSNKNPTNEFMVEDCSCVSLNMMLAAKALGLDSLWAGIKYDSDFYKRLIEYFKLPDGYIPVSLIGFGKAGEKKNQVDRYDKKKVHVGKF